MALAIDPVDLLCRQSKQPSDLLSALGASSIAYTAAPSQRLLPRGAYADHLVLATSGPLLCGASPHTVSGISGPPGLDVPGPLGLEASAYSSVPVHAWALEAKMKAEEAQARQRQWAEKVQMQYVQGQSILNALQETATDEAVASKSDTTTGGAFDRLVRQMGLKSDSPRSPCQREPSIGQTPPSKKKASEAATPQKAEKRSQKENWPSSSPKGEVEVSGYGRRGRGGRRGQHATVYQ